MKSYCIAALVFAFAGCSGAASTSFAGGGIPAAPSGVARAHAGSTGIVGEYFSLVDEASGDGVAWKDRLRPETPLDKLTRLYVNGGWLKPDKTGRYTLQLQHDYEAPRMTELLAATREKNPKAQILIVSGYDSDGAMYYAALKDPKYFADSVVSFIRDYKLDGYDCDWENGLEPAQLNHLAIAVRSALDAAGKVDGKRYLFTIAVWPTPQKRYDLPSLSKLVDQIAIMSYGAGDKLPNDTDSYTKEGFPRAKIMGGIETERDYGGPGGHDTLSEPNKPGSIADKSAYVRKTGMAGMMAWRMDNDFDQAVPVKRPTYDGAKQLWDSMTGSGE